jgi:IPT/TIG domain
MTRLPAPRGSRASSRAPSARYHLLAALLTCGAIGCDEQAPTPRLYTVTPAKGPSDRPLRLRITGAELLPRYHLDLEERRRRADVTGFQGFVGNGSKMAPLTDFVFLSPSTLEATLGTGLPAGSFDVVVIDPRGSRAVLAAGFYSFGPDLTAPVITIVTPATSTRLAPGTPVAARVVVDEEGALTQLAWEITSAARPLLRGKCADGPAPPGPDGPPPPPSRRICDFNFVVPLSLQPGEALVLAVTAIDDAPAINRTTVTRAFALEPRPALFSLEPGRGGSAGGTDVVVRGRGFLPGTSVVFGESRLEPDGGVLLDDGTIIGKTPSHPAGATVVRIQGPLGQSSEEGVFEYLPAPNLAAIDPPRGSAMGGQMVRILGAHFTSATRVYFGPTLARALPLGDPVFVNAGEIRGISPPGHGLATVHLIDPIAGWTAQPAAFVWEAQP